MGKGGKAFNEAVLQNMRKDDMPQVLELTSVVLYIKLQLVFYPPKIIIIILLAFCTKLFLLIRINDE